MTKKTSNRRRKNDAHTQHSVKGSSNIPRVSKNVFLDDSLLRHLQTLITSSRIKSEAAIIVVEGEERKGMSTLALTMGKFISTKPTKGFITNDVNTSSFPLGMGS